MHRPDLSRLSDKNIFFYPRKVENGRWCFVGRVDDMSADSGRAGWGVGVSNSSENRLLRRHPGFGSLMRAARLRIPGFAFDYLEGGVGDELCIARNRRALDDVEMVPRYGSDIAVTSTATRLFGQSYDLPLGVAPMGLSGLVWPDADILIAKAAEDANLPFILSMVSNADVETICRIALARARAAGHATKG
jgi:L-lactate dehydrogenase (cytochrome)